jgi:hypothetical protein
LTKRFPNCTAARNLSEGEITESLCNFLNSPTANWWLGVLVFFVHPTPTSLIETIRLVDILERDGIRLDYYHGTVASSDPLQWNTWWTNNYYYALAHATSSSYSARTQTHGVVMHTIPARRVLLQIAHAPETVFLPSGGRSDGIPPLTVQINFGLVDELTRGLFAQSATSHSVSSG